MATHDFDDDRTDSMLFPVLTAGMMISQYKIISQLGVGGMGEVYLAEDTKLKRQIALKFVGVGSKIDSEARERFIREARAAAALDHPNIVTIHDVAEHKGRPYIAMEYVEGEPLRTVISTGKLECELVFQIMIQLCSGISEAHSAGIIHRDIKPSNIMVDKKNRCRVLDFGLAKAGGDPQTTSAGSFMGTASYMSPEQGSGQEVDCRSDIFSLGVVFYEMLTGCCPFKRENIPATIQAVINELPPKITGGANGDAQKLQQVIDRMMAKAPADRYQNIDDVAADLERLCDGDKLPKLTLTRTPEKVPQVKGLAVLCLRNLGVAEDEYLSYGITEDLIVDLTRIGNIRVAPMRSVLKYRDSDVDLKEIAKVLDVSLILDGSIHRTEGGIRASAQLIEMGSGKNLWADRWEDRLDRLPMVKTALAQGVGRALNIDSSAAKAAQIGKPETRNPEAYEYYLRGKYTFEHRHMKADVDVAADLYKQALKLEPALLAARAGMAEILMFQDQYDDAAEQLLSAVVDARKRELPADEAQTLRLLAQCFSEQSMWDEAAHYSSESVKVSTEIGDLAGEAAGLGILIRTRQRRAMFDEALQLADRVLEINRQLNDRKREADALNLIGTVYLHKGDCDNANKMYNQALEIAHDRDQATVEAASIANLGTVCYYTGEFDRAVEYYERALKVFDLLGDAKKQAATAQNIGTIYTQKGKYRRAIEYYEQAYAIYEKKSERGRRVLTINNIAHVQIILGEYDAALKKLKTVLEVAEDLKYPLVLSAAHLNMAFAWTCRGDYKRAEKEFSTATDLSEQWDLRRENAEALSYAAAADYQQGRYEASYDKFERALPLAEEVQDKTIIYRCQAYLATRDIAPDCVNASFKRQQEIVDRADLLGEPRLIIDSKRLQAATLIRFGRTAAERQDGVSILNELLILAMDLGIDYEINAIESQLKALNG